VRQPLAERAGRFEHPAVGVAAIDLFADRVAEPDLARERAELVPLVACMTTLSRK
jgi:hypothetical protein